MVYRPHQHIIAHFGDESFQSITCTGTDNLTRMPRAGSGVVRMDPLRFLAGCRTRRLNQA